ncbi:hypothetical protein WR25_07662, partial [Diploscapter pachys]
MMAEVLLRIHRSRIDDLRDLLTKNGFLYELEILDDDKENRRREIEIPVFGGEGDAVDKVERDSRETRMQKKAQTHQTHLSNEYLEAKIDEMFDFGVDTDDKTPLSPRNQDKDRQRTTVTVQLDGDGNDEIGRELDMNANVVQLQMHRQRAKTQTPVREPSELRSRLNALRQQGQGHKLLYSVSAYRSMQREHRISISPPRTGVHHAPPMPRFSPVVPPAAGERMHAYRARAVDSGIVGKIALPETPRRHRSSSIDSVSASRSAVSRPQALATSTPLGTAQNNYFQLSNAPAKRATNDTTCFDESFVSTISTNSHRVNQTLDLKKQITRMNELIEIYEGQMEHCQKLVINARKADQLQQELLAQRSLLLNRVRIATLRQEIRRLSVLCNVRRPPPPVSSDLSGSMIVSNIAVHLNRNFCQRQKQVGAGDLRKEAFEDSSFAFVVVMRCSAYVEATGIVNLLGSYPLPPSQSDNPSSSHLSLAAAGGGHPTLHFTEQIQFSNLPVDFSIRVEVYALKIHENREEASCAAVLANKCRNLLLSPSPRRKLPSTGSAALAAPRTSSASSVLPHSGMSTSSEFILCGHLNLTRDTVGECRFFLDDTQYPLEGTVEMFTHCTTLPQAIEIEHRGFLTMYNKIANGGDWERFWAVLHRGVIDFWRYPEDEQAEKSPLARLRLSDCTNPHVSSCSAEVSPRPNTFSIEILVSDPSSTVERKRWSSVVIVCHCPEQGLKFAPVLTPRPRVKK